MRNEELGHVIQPSPECQSDECDSSSPFGTRQNDLIEKRV